MAPRALGRSRAAAALLGLVLLLPAPALLAFPPGDGDLDPVFGAGFGYGMVPFDLGAFKSDIATAVVETTGHHLLIAGTATASSTSTPRDLAVAKMDAFGAPDTAFGGGDGKVNYAFGTGVWDLFAAAVLSQGEIVLAGSVSWSTTDSDFLVVRLLADGALDTRFGGGDGWVTIPFDVNPGGPIHDFAAALAITPSEKILVAGTVQRGGADWDMAVAKLTANGALDTTFGGGTGKVVVPFDGGGYAGSDQAMDVLFDGEGMILLVGACANLSDANADFAFALLDGTGDLLPSFGTGGKVILPFDLDGGSADFANAAAVDANGRIFAAGYAFDATDTSQAAVACLTPAGTPCDDFGTGGKVHFELDPDTTGSESLTALAVDDLGRLVASGWTRPVNPSNKDVAVVRLLAGGGLDPSFGAGTGVSVVDLNHGPGADDDEALALALVGGKPVVAGASEYNGVDDDFFVLVLWVGLIQADGFESGTFSGWTTRVP